MTAARKPETPASTAPTPTPSPNSCAQPPAPRGKAATDIEAVFAWITQRALL